MSVGGRPFCSFSNHELRHLYQGFYLEACDQLENLFLVGASYFQESIKNRKNE